MMGQMWAGLSGQVVDPHWVTVCIVVAGIMVATLVFFMVSFPSTAMTFAWFVWPVTAYWALQADHAWAWWVLVPLPAWAAIVLVVMGVVGAWGAIGDWRRKRAVVPVRDRA